MSTIWFLILSILFHGLNKTYLQNSQYRKPVNVGSSSKNYMYDEYRSLPDEDVCLSDYLMVQYIST